MSATELRPATSADLAVIDHLRKQDGSSLGFVPMAKYEHIVNRTLDRGRERWKYERLLVVEDEGEVTGFLLGGLHRGGGKIEQVCVREDARRMERALLLTAAIESEARAKGLAIMHCRVAQDIDANMFWAAAGFEVVGEATSTKWNQGVSAARRPLYIYEKGLDQLRLLDARGGTASVALR